MSRFILSSTVLACTILTCGAEPDQPNFAPAPGSPFAVGEGPGDIILCDVNADGRLDIVTTNGKSKDVTILLGDGRGGFKPAPGSPLGTTIAMHLAVAGDLNKDGKLDLALTSHDSHNVTVLTGDGSGRFAVADGSPFPSPGRPKAHNHGLALGDVNGDSYLDILTGDQDDNSVSVLLNNGRAGFKPAPGSPFAVGKGPYPLALGDTNGDGKLDIVTPNTGSHDITVLLGDGKGSFKASSAAPISVARRPYYVTLGDLNGDRNPDLIVSHDDSNLATVLLNDGRGRFRAAGSPLDLGSRAWGVAMADLNKDQRMDLAAATNNSVTILLGDGRGGFARDPHSPFAAGPGSWKIAVGDLNLDGRIDIVTNNLEKNSVTVLLNK